MINIVIPMAGAGSRFASAGYIEPKPLIKVGSKRMIQIVIENLRPNLPHKFIFICQREHEEKYDITKYLRSIEPDCEVIIIDGLTDGAACTVLKAAKHIDNKQNLMIANSDQWVNIDINNYLNAMNGEGLIMTMTSADPKWSYVELNQSKTPTKVVEKEVVSNCATVGVYNFKRGEIFCKYAKKMIERQEKVNGEYYVAPIYNYLIKDGLVINIYNVGEERNGMYGLGIPEDLEYFLTRKDLLALVGC